MPYQTFTQTPTRGTEIQLIQSAINNAIVSLQAKSPFFNGVMLKNISLKSGSNMINHNLNRIPSVVFLGPIDNSAAVVTMSSSNLKKNTLILSSTAATTLFCMWIN